MQMRYFRRNKWNMVLLVISILVTALVFKYNIISSNQESESFHFNLLTINSIFAGFLFTGLGIMVSIADKPRIKNLDLGGYMDNYYNAIYIALIFHITSTLLALTALMLVKIPILIVFEQISIIFGVIFFIKSVIDIVKVIEKVRNGIKAKGIL